MRCDGFQQRGLSGSILTDKKADARPNPQFGQSTYHRNREWIVFPILYDLAQDCNCLKHLTLVPERVCEDFPVLEILQQVILISAARSICPCAPQACRVAAFRH